MKSFIFLLCVTSLTKAGAQLTLPKGAQAIGKCFRIDSGRTLRTIANASLDSLDWQPIYDTDGRVQYESIALEWKVFYSRYTTNSRTDDFNRMLDQLRRSPYASIITYAGARRLTGRLVADSSTIITTEQHECTEVTFNGTEENIWLRANSKGPPSLTLYSQSSDSLSHLTGRIAIAQSSQSVFGIATGTSGGYLGWIGRCNGDLTINSTEIITSAPIIDNSTISTQQLISGSVLIGTNKPVASSVFTIRSSRKGFLGPRMTSVERLQIVAPEEGLEVYDLTLHKKCYYTGDHWEQICSAPIKD